MSGRQQLGGARILQHGSRRRDCSAGPRSRNPHRWRASKRNPELTRVRLVVSRENEQDAMTLNVESSNNDAGFANAIAESLQSVTKKKSFAWRRQTIPPT
jgi:hypothetical protein